MGVMRPELVMKSIVPVVMAGVLGIYGLIIAVIISTGVLPPGGQSDCLLVAARTDPQSAIPQVPRPSLTYSTTDSPTSPPALHAAWLVSPPAWPLES